MALALIQVHHIRLAAPDRKHFSGNTDVVQLRWGATEQTVSASGMSKRDAAAEAIKKAIDDGWF